MSQKFKPSVFMRNRHLQTMFQTFFRKNKTIYYKIEEFVLEDGDFLEAYWHANMNPNPTTPIVIIFHGLTGSYRSPYVNGIMNKLSGEGYNVVLMHFRGCSGRMNKLPRAYHSGDTADASSFISSIHKRFSKAKLYAIGFSLGGNMLLKLLGETKTNSLLSAAISVSPPLQLDLCANAMNKGFSKFYQKRLIKDLNESLEKKYTIHDMQSLIGLKQEDVSKLKTFWEYDGVYTAPVHGFDSAQDYYSQCSSRQFLKDIHIPTLIVHSKDDPFMDVAMIPSNDELSSYVSLELSEYGGHVGFVEGSFFKPKYWLEERVVKFFKSI